MQDDCKLAMAGTISEDFGTSLRPSVSDGVLSEQRCPSGDSVTEWRSSEQVENGTTSTSPPYWDTDEDDDCGPKPSELYGRFTWKIESFSTINKRELRSNAFEVGGYRWYILIYPQGCDVCNHLSLFLCVANHDKLLPGWSHFAQFTIAVVNEDPKKSKYSDTLHKFWKKEHDWGWKKFMELSKVYDGFINDDTLIIKAQVQVIREKADRPFRCLDTRYRRELVRVYLSNVEQICRRFLEERIGKLSKFMEDKLRWSSFRIFWLGIDPSSRLHMSRDKTDAILKVVVKHFFIEKEVTSTLIMDSLYNGLKALEFQCENLKCRDKSVDLEELPAPVIHIDEDLFVLADDILMLMKRVVSNFLPHQSLPLKDDKCLLNRKKEGNSGDEATRDSIERDERRLMELGRRTIETFVLVHIFSKVEVSFKEAIALKRQEELIREEEAAFLAENDLKSKCGAAEKGKRTKKKQAKQKRNNRKGKGKGKNGRHYLVQEALEQTLEERTSDSSSKPVELAIERFGALADVYDTVDDVAYMVQPFDDRDASPTWDIDTSEPCPAIEASVSDVLIDHIEERSQCVTDDSSSTCSTDSIPSLFTNGTYKGAHLPNNITKSSPDRQNNLQNSETHNGRSSILSAETILVDGCSNYASGIKADQLESAGTLSSFKNELQHQKIQGEKEEVLSLQNNQTADDQFDAQRQSSSLNRGVKENIITPLPKHTLPLIVANTVLITSTSKVEPRCRKVSHSDCAVQGLAHPSRSQPTSLSETQKHSNSEQANAMSRPSSAPLTPALRLTAAISPIVQAVPLLSRSVSAAGRLGTDSSPSAASFLPQSYRNVIIGKTTSARMAGFIYDTAASVQSVRHFQAPSVHPAASSKLPPQTPLRKDQTSIQPGLTFGCLNPEALHHETCSNNQSSTQRFGLVFADNMEKLSICGKSEKEQAGFASATTPSQLQATIAEEFPHLDIINDLLDDEHDVGWTSRGPHLTFNRQYSLPGNLTTSCQFDHFEQSYEEGFLRSYGASGNPLQALSDEPLQQLEFSSYPNRYTQFDGLTRNHGPYGSSNLSVHRLGDGDANGYHYQIEDYLLRGQNGYYYRPANDL